MKKLKPFKVHMEIWRESFGGHDYRDDTRTIEVDACNCESAEKKALKIAFPSAGKGKRWSQSTWAKNVSVEAVVKQTEER
jgi:hypothetical protein